MDQVILVRSQALYSWREILREAVQIGYRPSNGAICKMLVTQATQVIIMDHIFVYSQNKIMMTKPNHVQATTLHTFEIEDVNRSCFACDGRAEHPDPSQQSQGPSIYDVHKISGFLPPPLVHLRPHEPDPLCGRPHAVDMEQAINIALIETNSTITLRT